MGDPNEALRHLPSVDSVMRQEDLAALLEETPRELVVQGVRLVLENRRRRVMAGRASGREGVEKVTAREVSAAIESWNRPALRKVLNATGVVVHTNLGRAPLSARAARAVADIAAGYSNLEMNLAAGRRGSRMDVVKDILTESTGAEDALVVNNNAAAVYLALKVLAGGREVVVSRGELVEIGGSFRIPDVMAASGARLVEVGTTNKTRVDDYRRSLGPDTALILKVHRSNFEMIGFTEEASIEQLVGLSRENRIPLMMDMGWGTLLEQLPGGNNEHFTASEILGRGVDLVCFSGDKMLGGPQCGIILGSRSLVGALAKDPMARALRVGKLTLAALWQTLALYRGGLQGASEIPVVEMLLQTPQALKEKAVKLLDLIRQNCSSVTADVIESSGQVGGGAMPLVELQGYAVALTPREFSSEELAARLRAGDPAVLARLNQDRVVLDVRTLIGEDCIEQLAGAVEASLRGGHESG